MTLTVNDIQQRSLEVFRELVDAYMETGEPVGSRTLSRRLTTNLSPATIRNVLADLEQAGLLYAPHTSAGRIPTDIGMRFFVNGLLEVGEIDQQDQNIIESHCRAVGRSFESLLAEATKTLSGLSSCAALVLAPQTESTLKHIEFVYLGPGRILVVLINEEGVVENRILDIPLEITPQDLAQASHYLQSRLAGSTLSQAKEQIIQEIQQHRSNLDELASKVVEAGVGVWVDHEQERSLIVRGQANLLQNVTALADVERIRELFSILDSTEAACKLLDASINAEGVQIFIGSDSRLFELAGCSLVVAPYKGTGEKILGAIGVVGPSRMNYSRIIPMVDYTAKMISRLLR